MPLPAPSESPPPPQRSTDTTLAPGATNNRRKPSAQEPSTPERQDIQHKMGAAEVEDYGAWAGDDDDFEVETTAEAPERYTDADSPYCPIYIGELVDRRYRIEHKLGHGGFSTVWLAYDEREGQRVALKVLARGDRADCETPVQDAIIRSVPAGSGLVTYQSACYVMGPTGYHQALVCPVQGPSLNTLYHLPAHIRIGGAKDLLQSLHALHNAGFVHSDLNMGAAMWHMDPIDHWAVADLYRTFGRPLKLPLTGVQRQGELVRPVSVPDEMATRPLSLGDFGHAFREGDGAPRRIQYPLAFCAPERLHGALASRASDMWSYMSIFATLYLGFRAIADGKRDVITRVVGMLGPFPAGWKDYYTNPAERLDWWYDPDCWSKTPPNGTLVEPFEKKLDRWRPDIGADERAHVLYIIQRGFSYEPAQRITAAELLADPSFNYIMGIYGV